VDAIRKARIKVVVDPAGGPGAVVTPGLLKDLGCQVIGINDELDGTFSQRPSEPVEKNLAALMKAVKNEGAALGVAHDGDADRCIFIDDKGRFVGGDESFAIVARHYLERTGGGIFCTPVSTSNLVREVVEAAGGTYITTAVGSPIVARVMIEKDATFGGEENGGLIFPQMQHCRDGAMSAAAMLEILATGGTSLSRLVDGLPEYYTIKEKFDCPDDRKQALMDRLKEAYKAEKDIQVDTIDGIKLTHPDGSWVLIRPSGTEPIYRVYAESKDAKTARRLADETLERATGLLTKTA
jgi:phosphomannomutase/phosphoglucomutase